MQSSQHPTSYFYEGGDDYEDLDEEYYEDSLHNDSKNLKSMLSYAKQAVMDQTKNSRIFDKEKEAAIPTFDYEGMMIISSYLFRVSLFR